MNKNGWLLIRTILLFYAFLFSVSAHAEIGKRTYVSDKSTEISYIVIKLKDGTGVNFNSTSYFLKKAVVVVCCQDG